MRSYTRLRETAVCVILLISLVGCRMPGWDTTIGMCFPTDDPDKPQCFSDFGEAVAFQRKSFTDAIAQIEPLDPPLAQSAVIVLPPTSAIERNLRGRDYRSEDDFRKVVTINEDHMLFIEQIIRQREIFAHTRLVRNSSVETVDIPATAFAIWLKDEGLAHIRAPHRVNFVPFGQDVSAGTGYLDAARKYLRVIEAYVLDHRAIT